MARTRVLGSFFLIGAAAALLCFADAAGSIKNGERVSPSGSSSTAGRVDDEVELEEEVFLGWILSSMIELLVSVDEEERGVPGGDVFLPVAAAEVGDDEEERVTERGVSVST